MQSLPVFIDVFIINGDISLMSIIFNIALSNVDFPAPFGPIIPVKAPSCIFKEISFNAKNRYNKQ